MRHTKMYEARRAHDMTMHDSTMHDGDTSLTSNSTYVNRRSDEHLPVRQERPGKKHERAALFETSLLTRIGHQTICASKMAFREKQGQGDSSTLWIGRAKVWLRSAVKVRVWTLLAFCLLGSRECAENTNDQRQKELIIQMRQKRKSFSIK